MALSNWDCLAFDLGGPHRSDRMTNWRGYTVRIVKSWVNVTETRTAVSGRWPRREPKLVEYRRARINEGDVVIGDWRIVACPGPQSGIYVIAFSADHDLVGDPVNRALFVGCGVYGYTDRAREYEDQAIDLGLDPATLRLTTVEDDQSSDLRVVARRGDGDLVTVADDVEDDTWLGVLPESVGYLKGMVNEFIRTERYLGWPCDELARIPWDKSERMNQGDLFFEEEFGIALESTPPGEAEAPVAVQTGVTRDEW